MVHARPQAVQRASRAVQPLLSRPCPSLLPLSPVCVALFSKFMRLNFGLFWLKKSPVFSGLFSAKHELNREQKSESIQRGRGPMLDAGGAATCLAFANVVRA